MAEASLQAVELAGIRKTLRGLYQPPGGMPPAIAGLLAELERIRPPPIEIAPLPEAHVLAFSAA